MLYAVFEYYLLMNLSLFQMLICVSPDPPRTIEAILTEYHNDPWMKTFHSDLIMKYKLNLASYEKFKPLFDEKKLR